MVGRFGFMDIILGILFILNNNILHLIYKKVLLFNLLYFQCEFVFIEMYKMYTWVLHNKT